MRRSSTAVMAFLAVAVLLLGWTPGAVAHKRVALVVGNSNYQYAPPLANPKNDAADMASVLKKMGFQVVEGIDLDKATFERTVRDFATTLQGADAGVFFYAGHGLQVAGQNYLVPIDAKAESAATLEFEMVRVNVIHGVMEQLTTTNILLLDACRNNPLTRNLARAMGTRATQIGQGLRGIETGVGTLISFATAPDTVASDGAGRNSPYTGALIRHIASSTDDLNTILINVRKDVRQATQGQQVPWENSSLEGRFYFNPAAAIADPPKAPQARLSEAAEAWDRTKESKSVPVLEAFIARYAETFYAELAREKVAAIRAESASMQPSPQKMTSDLPSSAPVKAPNEPLPRDPAVDPNVLKLVQTHPFFANAPVLRVNAYNSEGLTTWTYGAGEKYLQNNFLSATVKWLRSGLAEFVETNTVKRASDQDYNVAKTTSILAANGMVGLASKTVIERGGKIVGTVAGTTVAVEQMQGSIFPAQVGKKFSFIERRTMTSSYEKGKSNFSVEKTCEYVDRIDAAELHPRLSGPAYVLRCKTKQTGVRDSTDDTKFIEVLGISLSVDRYSQSEPLLQADGNTYSLGKLKGFSTLH